MISFSLDFYRILLEKIAKRYQIHNFYNSNLIVRNNDNATGLCCLRHDIDYCLKSALKMACLEHELGISASYFFLVDSDYYNILSKNSANVICQISNLGHEICLHFDVSNYTPDQYEKVIKLHTKCLEKITNKKVTNISYHNPGMVGLDNLNLDDVFFNLNNSYSRNFNKKFFYISDSLCKFKDPGLLKTIENNLHLNIHLLIHPIWWVELSDSRDQKIIDNLNKKKEFLLKNYSELLMKYGAMV